MKLLTRLFQNGDDSGALKGLGSSGYSTGFATTAASTSVDFVPQEFNGRIFTSTHEHYVGITGSVFTLALFQDAADELREHGHEPTYEMLIGPSDETTVSQIAGFVPVGESLVAYGANQDVARLNGVSVAGSYYIGTLEGFAIRVVPGIPQYYGFGFKSYGRMSQRNPLRVRVPEGISKVQFIAMPDPKAGSGINPLQNMMLYAKFGVGVGDRTNGTPRYTVSGTWANGTVS
ncbi:MAG: hypothetical protein E4H01_11835 [Lysobacterales bacterium]|nr:MAG: hypothetical protein E4H01_11835 [Xanthomonadales bacterium]